MADELQLVGRSLGVQQTGEVFVVNPKTWTVAYHGPIDGSFAAKKGERRASRPRSTPSSRARRRRSSTPPLKAHRSTSRIAAGRPTSRKSPTQATSRRSSPTSAWLAIRRAASGPFAMSSYEVVKGFSPMIREVLRTKRMPPYHADKQGAVWTDDMR